MNHFISIDDIDINSAMKDMTEGYEKTSDKKLIANLFYEPSTRTSSSFWAAAKKLGHDVLTINNVQYSSVAKGETLEDTIRTLASYVDAIVLRHPEKGAAQRAAEISPVPIINAGDGDGEHPTQTLLDLYTIYRQFNQLQGLVIVLMGDLKYGRTVHSLVKAMGHSNEIYCIAPKSLKLPSEFGEYPHFEEPNVHVLQYASILYVVRTQRERMDKQDFYNFDNKCVVDRDVAKDLNKNAIVMHPFPRTNELPPWFDTDPRGRYFDQMKNGLFVRQYILNKVLDNESLL